MMKLFFPSCLFAFIIMFVRLATQLNQTGSSQCAHKTHALMTSHTKIFRYEAFKSSC